MSEPCKNCGHPDCPNPSEGVNLPYVSSILDFADMFYCERRAKDSLKEEVARLRAELDGLKAANVLQWRGSSLYRGDKHIAEVYPLHGGWVTRTWKDGMEFESLVFLEQHAKAGAERLAKDGEI